MKKTLGMIRIAIITGVLVAGTMSLFARDTAISSVTSLQNNDHKCTSGSSYSGVLGGSHECTVNTGTYSFTIGAVGVGSIGVHTASK